MGKKKGNIKKTSKRKLRKVDVIGFIIGFIVLAMLWMVCILNLMKGDYFGYENYYGQPVGTLLLLLVLIVATPVSFIAIWKTIKGQRISSLKGMDKAPYKWPWE